MPKALLIGKALTQFSEALTRQGFSVKAMGELSGSAKHAFSDAGLLVIDSSLKGLPATLPLEFKNIPKLVVSLNGQQPPSSWFRVPFSYVLQNPSIKDLIRFSLRILREHAMGAESDQLKATNSMIQREISLIDDINKMLTTSRDLNDILILIAKKINAILKAESWSAFNILDTPSMTIEKLGEKNPKKTRKLILSKKEGIAGWVASSGNPLLVKNAERDKHFSPQVDGIGHKKVRTVICAPLKTKVRTVAVLELINKADGSSFTEEEYTLFLRLISHASLAVEQLSLYQRLEELAVTDDLTSLFNSRYLNRSIEAEILRSKKYGTSVSLVFMDVDHFKDINDNFGHLVGSKVLVEMGELLMDMLRTADIVARYGGDEFVIVLPQTTLHNAMIIAERIRKAIEARVFMSSEGHTLHITASFGVASYPESSKSKETLLKLADEAMYSVKRRTRNAVYAII